MDVSSVHSPGFRPNGPPPTMSVMGSKLPLAERATPDHVGDGLEAAPRSKLHGGADSVAACEAEQGSRRSLNECHDSRRYPPVQRSNDAGILLARATWSQGHDIPHNLSAGLAARKRAPSSAVYPPCTALATKPCG
jgi:hypothetical protein